MTIGAATVAAAYPFSTSAGNLLVAISADQGNNAPTGISDTSGDTWILAGCTVVYLHQCAYYARNAVGGTNTVTSTYASAQNLTLIVLEYRGFLSSYPFETSIATGLSGSPSISSVVTAAAGDLIVSSIFDENSYKPGFIASTGFTERAAEANPYSDYTSLAVFDNGGAAGAYTNSVTAVGGSGNISQLIIVFRSVYPNPGRLQQTQNTSSGVTSYLFPNAAGDTLIALMRYPSGATLSFPPTDSAGNTWNMLPTFLNTDAGDNLYLAYARNCKAGANTVTAGGSTPSGMMVWEYAGLAAVSPVAGSSGWTWPTGTSSTTQSTGNVTMPGPGILFSIGADMTQPGNTLSASSGFATGQSWSSNAAVSQWDEVVSAGNYSNTVTAGTAGTALEGILVGLSTTNLTYPILRQINRWQSTPLTPVVAGNLLVVVGNSYGGAIGVPTDSQGNTYHLIQGGSPAAFGMWWTVPALSGTLTVSWSGGYMDSQGVMEFERISSPSLDQSNVGTSTTSSVATGSLTTTAANEIVVSAAFNLNRNYSGGSIQGMTSGWSPVDFISGAHYTLGWSAIELNAPMGSYSNTFPFASSGTFAAVIASFKGSVAAPVIPSISVITERLGEFLSTIGGS